MLRQVFPRTLSASLTECTKVGKSLKNCILSQIAVDCPRTVPDVSFFQQEQVQKSLERILYTW